MLVKPDADSFAAALIAGLTDDHLIEKLRRGCRENRSRFSDKTEIESHLAIYRSL
jgi:glycosyltransferase involved in cell wall biosynthesis